MKDDRLLEDRELADAFRSVRDAYDGTNADSNLTLQRALFRTRTQERRQRLTRWVVLPIAAVLVASTAWAGVTGKLAPAVHSMLESFHAEHAPPPGAPLVVAPTASALAANEALPEPAPSASAVDAPADPAPVEAKVAAPVVPPPAASAVVSAPPVTYRTSSPSSQAAPAAAAPPASAAPTVAFAPAVDPPKEPAAPAASAPDPHAALFAEAHRLHFTERDPARALAAWDRYLVDAPNGRFAPEARYNRALALVRLGRAGEAKTELDAFANGTYGSYRREEAKALLDALAKGASRP